jgi:hypothetical protein
MQCSLDNEIFNLFNVVYEFSLLVASPRDEDHMYTHVFAPLIIGCRLHHREGRHAE